MYTAKLSRGKTFMVGVLITIYRKTFAVALLLTLCLAGKTYSARICGRIECKIVKTASFTIYSI